MTLILIKPILLNLFLVKFFNIIPIYYFSYLYNYTFATKKYAKFMAYFNSLFLVTSKYYFLTVVSGTLNTINSIAPILLALFIIAISKCPPFLLASTINTVIPFLRFIS